MQLPFFITLVELVIGIPKMFTKNKSILLLFFLTTICFATNIDLRISEFMASHATIQPDTLFGEYPDWIEIYNGGNDIPLSSIYLSDDSSNPHKWKSTESGTLRTGEYAIFWADGNDSLNHTSFKLSSAGEFISISTLEHSFLDSVTYPLQITDVSYGRSSSNSWTYFAVPTIGNSNSAMEIVTKDYTASPPQFSNSGGIYSGSEMVSLSAPNGGNIYYTLNSSTPTLSSTKYTSPISMSTTTVIRARVFRDNHLPSSVITQTYLVDEDISLPVISIVTDSANLWDDYTGIYTIGKNGISNYGFTANYVRRWERGANIQYLDTTKGGKSFSADCGLSIAGERRHMYQKSLKVNFKDNYGVESIEGLLFSNKNTKKFRSFFIRHGGFPDYQNTMFKDGFLQTLVGTNMNVDWMGYKPSVLYLNSQYWGLYNLREKMDENYLASTYGIDPNNVDIIENQTSVANGDNIAYKELMNYAENCDPKSDEAYQYFVNNIDIASYFDYSVAQMFLGNMDWPGNNIRVWREKKEGAKWRWLFIDIDVALGTWEPLTHNMLEHSLAENSDVWWNPPQSTLLLRKVLGNTKLRDRFIQTYSTHLNITFNPIKTVALLDSMQVNIEAEMPHHISRWQDCDAKDVPSGEGCVVSSMEDWHTNVDEMRTYLQNRTIYVSQHINNYFELDGTVSANFSVNETRGKILINGVDLKGNFDSLKLYKNIPLTLQIIPNAGWKYWVDGVLFNGGDSATVSFSSDTTLAVKFFSDTVVSILPDTIIADTTLLKAESPFVLTEDLVVLEGAILTIQQGVEILLNSNSDIFIYGEIIAIGKVDDSICFMPNYRSDIKSWNSLKLINSQYSEFDYVRIIDGSSQANNSVTASFEANNSKFTMNHSFISGEMQPVIVWNSFSSFKNTTFECESTCDFVNAKGGYPIIDSCTFIGNEAVDTDAIDYDGVDSGKIINSTISNYLGGNSDAIDLGEGSKNVLVENNFINNCTDKGVSIGQGAEAIINNNFIINCSMGVGVKDSLSYGKIYNTTFWDIDYGVASFEKNPGNGGGKAEVINTIFSNINNEGCYVDSNSTLLVTYSIFEKDFISGVGNIKGTPTFINAAQNNFNLSSKSIGVNRGSPNLPKDSDGSNSDIGAYLFFEENTTIKIPNDDFVPLSYNSSGRVITFRYELTSDDPQNLVARVFNAKGQLLKKKQEVNVNAGVHSLELNLLGFGFGIYLFQVHSDEFTKIYKIAVFK
jgi:hypothetical protein